MNHETLFRPAESRKNTDRPFNHHDSIDDDLFSYLPFIRESFVMNETMRTAFFVGAAALSLVVANLATPKSPVPKEFSQVGKSFFPDFEDASKAKSLQVVSYNSETAAIRVFGVEQGPDGVWRIPSRNGYPVDGKERLSKAATSVIGINREQLAGPRKSQHAEFGVLDPLAESVSDFTGVGNRITLKDGKNGKTLADLIIGKEVKGRTGYYYVRVPSEDPTYIAKVSIDISTKFTDWIEPDLLKVEGPKLRTIVIDKHSIEFVNQRGRVTGKESNKLSRATSTDKWSLEGLDDTKEEVNEDEVRKLVQALDDLKIVGVRPKSERLKKKLQDQAMAIDQQTADELEGMGFFFGQGPGGAIQMVSQEGDVTASTEQGVVYDLHFGTVFTGTEDEVEAGFIKPSDANADAAKPNEPKPETTDKADATDKKDDSSKSKKIKSRYLFVQARFDAEGLGPKPEEPVKPEEPPEQPAPAANEPADATAAENDATKFDPKKNYEAMMAMYEADVKKHETDLKAYDEKITAGQKLVKDLNRRFAEWYYVISGESFENLRQGRATLVKEKSAQKPAETVEPAPM